MPQTVSAADANRQFSRLLRDVAAGDTVVVTSHGRPVARIVPATDNDAARQAVLRALIDRLSSQPVLNMPKTSRDEIYDL